MIKTNIVLKNKYLVKQIPKTQAMAWKKVKVGDIVEITLELTWRRSGDNHCLNAYYPLINGIGTGIPTINKLIEKGMILEEINYLGKNMVDLHTYQTEESNTTRKLSLIIDNEYLNLNDEVEIIEEPKKIEKIPLPSFDEFKRMSAEERYVVTAKEYDLLDELIDEINNLKEK